jgi:protein-disulfide isomerase
MNDQPGKVYLELRYFPSPKQERSMLTARFAECSARQGKFWQFHDVLIPRQHRWRTLADPRPVLTQFAKEAGLDLPGLELCLKDKSVTELILEERNDAKALGVRRTPTYFINDKMLVGLESLRQELEQYSGESDH